MGRGKKQREAAPRAILVRTPNWLGDVLMSTAFVNALLRRFPEVRVDLIVRKGFEVLPLPHRGRLLPYDKQRQSPGGFAMELRGQGYSHFFVLPPSFSSAWMAFRSGVPRRIGYVGGLRRWLLQPALAYRQRPRSVHLTHEYLELLSPWGKVEPALPGLDMDASWITAHFPAAAGQGGYVLLAPGAEFGTAKQWPISHFVALAAACCRAGQRVVVMGLEKDWKAGERILAHCTEGRNLCGQTGLAAAVALVAGSDVLISNDSGAMHIAAALGKPQVALFGSSNPTWSSPRNPQARVLYRELACSPCYRRECPLGHKACLTELSPQQVLDALAALPLAPSAIAE